MTQASMGVSEHLEPKKPTDMPGLAEVLLPEHCMLGQTE